jgi:hypothetical protein
MAAWHKLVVLLAGIPVAISCSSVLGIEEAHLKTKGPDTPEDDGGGGGGGDIAKVKPLCAAYCAAALSNCMGSLELYPNLKFCLAVCNAMPLGLRTDTAGDSVGCRLHFAESAATVEKQFNCSAAGPGGNGVCGTNCEGFCSIDQTICPGIYVDRAACLLACKTFPVLGDYNDSIQSGNSVECRLYHSNAAAAIDREQHCPHTDIKHVGGPCG